MPQIYKGDREPVTGRLPTPYAKKLNRYVQLTGGTKTDFIAEAVMKALDQVDIENVNPRQERLKLSA